MTSISIILPVFNAGHCLRRCLDSLLSQTFRDFEILIIDDGSTDSSGVICDEYAKKDERIKVFHKKNEGVASARQLGTDYANGEYSIHCDADDWMDPEMLGSMYEAAKRDNSDVVICDFLFHSSKGIVYKQQQPTSLSSESILQDIIGPKLQGSMCNKLVRHSLYKKYNIHYLQGIDYCEDNMIWMQLYQNEIKTSYIPKAYYHYDWTGEEHITKINNYKKWQSQMNYNIVALEMMPDKYSQIIKSRAIPCVVSGFVNGYIKKEEYVTFALTNNEIDGIEGKRVKLCLRLIKYLGFDVASLLYKVSNVLSSVR